MKFGDLVLLGVNVESGVLNMYVAPETTIAFFSSGTGLLDGDGKDSPKFTYRYPYKFTQVTTAGLRKLGYKVPESMK